MWLEKSNFNTANPQHALDTILSHTCPPNVSLPTPSIVS